MARSRLPFADEIFCDGGPEKNLTGVKDLLISRDAASEAGDRRVYLSYATQLNPGCLVLKLVRFDIRLAGKIVVREKHDLFKSDCAPDPPTYTEVGGALAETPTHLYFSVGDFGHGRARPSDTNLCSIHRLLKAPGDEQPVQFAIGLRNAEGLAVVPASTGEPTLFASDMGPRGGDEINVVTEGDDFGYSDTSYGLTYDHNTADDYAGPWDDHANGKEPAYVFMPAVAPTDIVAYEGDMFRNWRGSLLMTTLRAQTLYRIRLKDTRVVYAEPIADLGERMRFVRLAPDGSVYVKADPDRFIRVHRPIGAKPLPIAVSQLVQSKGCLNCHDPGGAGSAPSLRGKDPTVIYQNLNHFAAGSRPNPTMNKIAAALSYDERRAVADYLATAR